MELSLQEMRQDISNQITKAKNNNQINEEFLKTIEDNIDTQFAENIMRNNIDTDAIGYNKARIAMIDIKETARSQINTEISKTLNANKSVRVDESINEITTKILNDTSNLTKLKENTELLLLQNPNNTKLIELNNILLDTEKIQTLRSIIPLEGDQLDNKDYLEGLYKAIDNGSSKSKRTYKFNGKDYTPDELNELFAGSDLIKSLTLKRIKDRLISYGNSGSSSSKNNANMAEFRDSLFGRNNKKSTSLTSKQKNEVFNPFIDSIEGVDIKNLIPTLQAGTAEQQERKLKAVVAMVHNYADKGQELPDIILQSLRLPTNDFDVFKKQVEIFKGMADNPTTNSYFKDGDFIKLRAAAGLPDDAETQNQYFTDMKSFFMMSDDQFKAFENSTLEKLGMETLSNSNVKRELFIKNKVRDLFKGNYDEVVIDEAYSHVKKSLLSTLTLRNYYNKRENGKQDLEVALMNLVKPIINNTIPLDERIVLSESQYNSPAIASITNNPNLIAKDTYAHKFVKGVKNVIERAGGEAEHAMITIAILNHLKNGKGYTADIADGFEMLSIDESIELNEELDRTLLAPVGPSDTQENKIEIISSPISDNFSNKTKSIEELFSFNDADTGKRISLIPNQTFVLEAVKNDDNSIFGYKILLKGKRNTALDANPTSMEYRSYILNPNGSHLVLPLHEMIQDNDIYLKEANIKKLLIQREKSKSREVVSTGEIITSTITGEPLPDKAITKTPKADVFTDFEELDVGDNILSNDVKVNLTPQDIKYINRHRLILGANMHIVNDDGSVTTSRGEIISSTHQTSSYNNNVKTTYHLVPSVISDFKNNKLVFREIEPGEEAVRESYIRSIGGLDQFPTYNTLEDAEAGERKLKKIISNDYKEFMGIYNPSLSFTQPKSRGRMVSLRGINTILGYTEGKNSTNRKYMMATLGTESDHGTNANTYKPNRVSFGIAQMDKIRIDPETQKEIVGVFDDLKRRHKKELNADKYGNAGTGLRQIFADTVKKIEDGINRDFPDMLGKNKKFIFKDLTYEDLNIPLASIAVLRLWVSTQGAKESYDTADEAYNMYKVFYNTRTDINTKDKFTKYWNDG